MASDYAVPCIRRATEQDMSGLTLSELSALDGFPNVQVIGAEGEVTNSQNVKSLLKGSMVEIPKKPPELDFCRKNPPKTEIFSKKVGKG